MIRISRSENHGSPIDCCGDLSDKNPAISVAEYTTMSTAEQMPLRVCARLR